MIILYSIILLISVGLNLANYFLKFQSLAYNSTYSVFCGYRLILLISLLIYIVKIKKGTFKHFLLAHKFITYYSTFYTLIIFSGLHHIFFNIFNMILEYTQNPIRYITLIIFGISIIDGIISLRYIVKYLTELFD